MDWIGTVTSWATKTVVVEGKNKKEALYNLRNGISCTGCDVNYKLRGFKILRRDGYKGSGRKQQL
jgi:hypothetical protein